jgi:hypothetical protein
MNVTQVVQVQILGAPRKYTYGWVFNPLEGGEALAVGDRVEIPPNQVQAEGSSATVVELGSSYRGEVKSIVRKIVDPMAPMGDDSPKVSGPEDDLWAGWETGQY